MILLLKILGGIAALLLGVYLGRGQSRQTAEDMAQELGKGRRRKAKRHFTWINYLKPDKRASERRSSRTYFRTAVGKSDSNGKSSEG